MTTPEPCLSGRCWSPAACGGWGYCRERDAWAKPTPEQVDENRRKAADAIIEAIRVAIDDPDGSRMSREDVRKWMKNYLERTKDGPIEIYPVITPMRSTKP